MRESMSTGSICRALRGLALLIGGLPVAGHGATAAGSTACPQDNAGLTLAPGFCASVFADHLGHPRHLLAAADGVVYVNTWSGRYYRNAAPPRGGFLIALRDSKGNGHADVQQRFGETVHSGGAGGTGIALYKGYLYAESNDRIVRYALAPGAIAPTGPPQVIVSGLPLGGDHPMHPFAIDADGQLYVDVASATNACQKRNRMLHSAGIEPCAELLTRAGIWRYDANRTGQRFSPAERFATGIRNADGIAIDASGHDVYATQHGRDQLAQNWPERYTIERGALLPSEELLRVVHDGDYGWPECYYDPFARKLVLAPEYGGDGRKIGSCAGKREPVAAFPAHWAPDDLLISSGDQLPERYRHGAFIAFHGSWNRAPFPQGGYNVVFQPLEQGRAVGECEIFAQGFAGPAPISDNAAHRPTGLALAADGALYVSDDQGGRIYRIAPDARSAGSAAKIMPCPSLTAAPGKPVAASGAPPEGAHTNAGQSANLPVPPGATREMLRLGARVYAGEVGGATCVGCHGTDASGTSLGPNLTDRHWLWSDGSLAGIRRTIVDGVPNPKQARSPMPAMGGARLDPDQVSAVAAYVWALSHRSGD